MLKVVTWNLNSVKARKDRLVAFLKREEPHLVCLQELKGIDETFPLEEVKATGYDAAVYGQKTYNGVAVLSRAPLEVVSRGFGDGVEDPAARFLCVKAYGLTLASAYIPNGQAVGTDKYAYKLEWLKRLRRYLQTHHSATQPLIVGGDFNVAPEDRDVYDPDGWRGQILFSDPEKAGLKDVCAFGLQDTFRKHHSEGNLYSWWDYRMLGFPKNRGARIDFLFATAPLWEKCLSSRIDRDERKGTGASDHAPVIAEFDWKA